EEWQKMADQLSIWDYVTNWKCYIAPFPNLISIWKNARLFAECKAIHVLEESASGTPAGGVYSDLKTYLIGKLLWDPRMSEETYNTYINEFLEAYYGPGWREVRRYIDLEHEVTADKKMRCFADVDISAAFSGLSHEVEAFMLQHYEAKPYQPVYPNPHYLDDLIPRLPEAEGCFKRAAEQAETELQRMHAERSLFSLTYVRLFCTKHDRKTMSDAERAEYEAEVEKFYQDKKKYGYHYNISTTLIGN
ncbi:MAG: DUF4838 domain-containing protein, partial [Clostridia bacterium]|nr:DUF4838 domain-containing protein [Clostridia bacterium]